MSKVSKVSVIGGGSWATAIVKILSENTGIQIGWWIRNTKQVNHINQFRQNPNYLSDVKIDINKVLASNCIEEVLKDSQVIILAVPAAFVHDILTITQNDWLKDKIIATAVKGMIPEENLLISQYLEKYKSVKKDNICMISGPCHSEEVAMERKSYLTIAGNNRIQASIVSELFSCRFINTSVSIDLYGAEYAAVMKNVYGIACGVARGLNYGDNFQAVLVSNALSEMQIALNQFYPLERNITQSAYNGDLLVTTYSQFSRNRTLGNMLGRGYSIKTALVEMNMIAEGYYAVRCLYELAQEKNVDLPIISAVYNIIYEKISPSIEFSILENKLI